jgi:hypothetical protein
MVVGVRGKAPQKRCPVIGTPVGGTIPGAFLTALVGISSESCANRCRKAIVADVAHSRSAPDGGAPFPFRCAMRDRPFGSGAPACGRSDALNQSVSAGSVT